MPIFGIGGIETVEHVVEFLIAGANAVQVGTANFRDPSLSGRLVDELAAWCEAHGVRRVAELSRDAQDPAPAGAHVRVSECAGLTR